MINYPTSITTEDCNDTYSYLKSKVFDLLNLTDSDSYEGSIIKDKVKDIIDLYDRDSSLSDSVQCVLYRSGVNESYCITIMITKEALYDFYNKYCNDKDKAIKDDIYYNINLKRNNYKFLTISRDLDKSTRKIPTNNTKTNNRKSNRKVATYDEISKDPEMIANYYSSKYGLPSDGSNIVTMFTEDDVMCLNCGCISDERLSDVPDRNLHLSMFKCPKCKSENSPVATFNKHLCKLTTTYRNNKTN